ncbi:hypothetical protein FQB35_04105 [Crassaminicella thermophila]|uniref:PD-(D/E)XK nuclease superfamily protein n=1 Tax=Crassaminicella thermophila TaxID=2599308 RepID=A0A5C0SF77_CRATE|nr:hypothetical protein [Crassaminicella thermophila]QEK11609.1 hypothetical protein FQB35_04105 [Crassaminicella thermophila]
MNKTIEGPADLIIEIKNWEYSKWYIQLKTSVNKDMLYNIYGSVALNEWTSDIKFSIAVSSEIEFETFIKKPPKSLKVNFYVMLVNLDSGKILKEEKLCQY